ncbi:Protein of unknown function [Cyclobacterium lianum]|uniref:DUF2490 domain-containing protein n=1 Tax=Cyclobacterium lianum TaxID=388280 RepID=A0A1M7NZE7_9BACT|nr:DUF2490 domain-containing protein [Cyclobacterium lianum]SHN09591.1 Protein of unknown function [Cyclobacterium lianum]
MKFWFCFWVFLTVLSANAQEGSGENEPYIPKKRTNLSPTTELWNGLYIKLRLTDRIFWYQENHYRRRSSLNDRTDFLGRMGQIYNRFGFTYLFNDQFEVTVGPTVVLNFAPDSEDPGYLNYTIEPRIWHQWLLTQGVGSVKILHQFRFEHRWKRYNDIGADYNYTNRFRYKITAYVPLNKPKMENKTFFIAPSNEIFFQTGSHITDILEENRLYTAIGYTYNNFMFFGGHMWTYGPTSIPSTYSNRHVIRLNIMYTLDFRNKRRPVVRSLPSF